MAVHGPEESGVLADVDLDVDLHVAHAAMPSGDSELRPAVEPDLVERRDPLPIHIPLIVTLVFVAISGGAIAWLLRPAIAPDPRIAAAHERANAAEVAETAQRGRAAALESSLAAASQGRHDAEARLAAAQAQLAGAMAADARRRGAAAAVLARLSPAIDRTLAAVWVDGSDVRVRIADRALFRPNDDALIDRGRAMLDGLASALKDLPECQIWVQGHTDDTPVPLPRPAAAAVFRTRLAAGLAADSRFPTNWELSGARALAVVRYLQDTAKLDPTRLAALAFGQYAPVPGRDKAVNRRVEIIVTPKHP